MARLAEEVAFDDKVDEWLRLRPGRLAAAEDLRVALDEAIERAADPDPEWRTSAERAKLLAKIEEGQRKLAHQLDGIARGDASVRRWHAERGYPSERTP